MCFSTASHMYPTWGTHCQQIVLYHKVEEKNMNMALHDDDEIAFEDVRRYVVLKYLQERWFHKDLLIGIYDRR